MDASTLTMAIATTFVLAITIIPHAHGASCSYEFMDDSCCAHITKELKNMENKSTEGLTSLEKKLTTELTCVQGKLDSIAHVLTQILDKQQHQGNVNDVIRDWRECYKGMAGQRSFAPRILVRGPGNKIALCDTQTDGGGWLIIQRRSTGRQDFYLTWDAYKSGFGDMDDYWIGLDVIHDITSRGVCELRVDMESEGNKSYARYSKVLVGDAASNYVLHIGGYSGDAGDSLTWHDNMKFSTHEVDNDGSTINCAEKYHGAWWYKHCYASNLNGEWGVSDKHGITWEDYVGLTFTEMKLRFI